MTREDAPQKTVSPGAGTDLDSIGILKRREIEARILAPVLEALGREFGRQRVLEVAREAIAAVARQHGHDLQAVAGGNSLSHFVQLLPRWQKDNATEVKILAQSEEELSFDVVRCRYAEMYRALGIPEIGELLSCNRDGSMMSGFNPEVEMTRTQTVMQGASHCDFRFRRGKSKA
jgi:L-2-amino-thiazoline-4-carboxylic acid hydrolase-like protein